MTTEEIKGLRLRTDMQNPATSEFWGTKKKKGVEITLIEEPHLEHTQTYPAGNVESWVAAAVDKKEDEYIVSWMFPEEVDKRGHWNDPMYIEFIE